MKASRIIKTALLKRRIKEPVSLILLVTSKCNARCSFCFFKESLNKKKNEMTLDEYRVLSSSIKQLNRVIISGGEPYLRKDLDKICNLFYKKNGLDELSLATNGLTPKPIAKMTRKILKACPGLNVMVSVSIDGTKEVHDKIRGVKGSFKKAVETCRLLAELKKEYPGLRVHITTCVTKENYENLHELISFVRKRMKHINTHNFEFVRGKHSKTSKLLPTVKQCEEFVRLNEDIIDSNRFHFSDSIIKSKVASATKKVKFKLMLDILKNKKRRVHCFAGELISVINETGDVFLCELFQPVGNLRNDNFSSIWNSDKANLQRKLIRDKKCFCTHSCFQGTNVLYNPYFYPKILKAMLR